MHVFGLSYYYLSHVFGLYHAIIRAMHLVSVLLLLEPCIWALSCYYLSHVYGLYHAVI
jgi:hypothetical protein